MTTNQRGIVIGFVVFVVFVTFCGLCFAVEPLLNHAYTPVLLGI